MKNPIPIRLAALVRGDASEHDPSLAENKRFDKKDCPRTTGALDEHELERARATTTLPLALAELREELTKLERDLNAIPTPLSPAKQGFLTFVSTAALVADGVLCIVPAASMAGIPLSELGSASLAEAGVMGAFCAVVGGSNLILAKFSAYLLVRERSPWGAGVAAALLLGNAVVAYVRVGTLETGLDLAEFVIFGIIPPVLGLSACALGALVDRATEPARTKRADIATLRAKVVEAEAELRAAWDERMRTAAVLDGLPVGAAPMVPLERPSQAPTPSWVTAAVIFLALALGGFLFAGCGGERREVPLALAVLVDTSASMKHLPPAETAVAALTAADAAGALRGGSEVWIYETKKESVEPVGDPLVIPRRFTPRADPKVERATLLTKFTDTLLGRPWPEGDSLVVPGLKEIGEELATIPAERKVALLVSDARGFQAGPHGYYFGEKVPEPQAFIDKVEALGSQPTLDGVEVLVCGLGTHPSENDKPFSEKQNVATVNALRALIERGGGTLSVVPSCARIDLTRALTAHDHGGDK